LIEGHIALREGGPVVSLVCPQTLVGEVRNVAAFNIHTILHKKALCVVDFREREGVHGKGEALLGPPTLGQEEGLPHGRSSAKSAGRSLVCLVLIEGVTKLKFTILRLGATIYDGGKSERSDG